MLIESLRGLGRSFVEILANRMETLSLDLKEDRIRLVSLLILGGVTFFLLGLGIILGVLWVVLAFWEANRFLVVGVLTGLFLIAGLTLVAILVQRLKTLPGAFAGTITELDKDREALGGRGRRGD